MDDAFRRLPPPCGPASSHHETEDARSVLNELRWLLAVLYADDAFLVFDNWGEVSWRTTRPPTHCRRWRARLNGPASFPPPCPEDPEGLGRPVYFVADVVNDITEETKLRSRWSRGWCRHSSRSGTSWSLPPRCGPASTASRSCRSRTWWRTPTVRVPRPGLLDHAGEQGELGAQVHLAGAGRADLIYRYPSGAWLVVELKRGLVEDTAVDQIERYIEAVGQHHAQPGAKVVGVLIGFGTTLAARRRIWASEDLEFFPVTLVGERLRHSSQATSQTAATSHTGDGSGRTVVTWSGTRQ